MWIKRIAGRKIGDFNSIMYSSLIAQLSVKTYMHAGKLTNTLQWVTHEMWITCTHPDNTYKTIKS